MQGAGVGHLSFLEDRYKTPTSKGTVSLEETVPSKKETSRSLESENLATQGTVPLEAAVTAEVAAPRGTVPSKDTVPYLASVPFKSEKKVLRATGVAYVKDGGLKYYRATRAQDGHSFAEERLYQALWNARQTVPETKESRLISVGWDLMGQLAGMTWRNARENCLRLIAKFAMERVSAHQSEIRKGTTYRILSYVEILRRRREAGMEWVVRNRGGVQFVVPAAALLVGVPPLETQTEGTVPLEGTVTSLATVSVPLEGTDTVVTETTVSVPSVTTPLDTMETGRQPASPSSDSVDVGAVAIVLRNYAETVDDTAVVQLVEDCRRRVAGIRTAEIIHFIHQKAKVQGVRNMLGFLLTAVPRAVEGDGLKAFRIQAGEMALRQKQALDENRRYFESVLQDPAVSEEERQLAKQALLAEIPQRGGAGD